MSHSNLTKIRTDHSPNQMLNYYTSTAKVTTRQLQQRIFPPALTNDFHSCPPTKHHLIRPPLLTRKLSTKADTSSPCNMNPKHLAKEKTDSAAISSGTTHPSARTSALTSDRFLALVDKHFPKDHKLHKIANRNTIKISYSCMNSTKRIIDNHNKRILTSSQANNAVTTAATEVNKTCNCRQKNACPLAGNCLQPCVIYQAAVTRKDNNKKDTYIGLTENTFKTRYRNHTASFRHAKLRNSTELSKHIWTLKDNCIDHFISWRILSSHSPYSSASKRCNLCLEEKFLIICQPDLSTLNKRNELVSSCRHRNKALLRNS